MTKFTLQQDAPVSREQIREQIRQSVREAQSAAKAAVATKAQAGNPTGRAAIIIPAPSTTPGTPGTAVAVYPENMIPPQAESIAIAFFVMVAAIIIGFPLMRAIARRIERGTPAPAALPNDLRDQLKELSQSVDAIAIEVERISEGQRFTTKMLSERTQAGTMITPGGQQ